MKPSLLVLAAGMGSRYGGLKQLDPVGPSGETILDYAVFDAIRAGFTRVVFVIRRDFEDVFRTQIGARYAGKVEVDYAFQAVSDVPAGFVVPAERTKPWGTGQAVWCARAQLTGPFAVIGADDFFGRDAFVQLAGFLREVTALRGTTPHYAMVGYRLSNTLSAHGTVSRGVCRANAAALLETVVEHTGIAATAVGPGREFTGDELVSMNCWAFTPDFLTELGRQFAAFLALRGGEPKSEFYLPTAVSEYIAAGGATVQVRPTTASWFGVTYREDKPRVETALAELVEAGEYPAMLFPR